MNRLVDLERGRQRRWRIFTAGILFLFLLGVGRLFDLQVIHGATHRQSAENNRFRMDVLRARRGLVLDRAGRVLVENFPSFVLTLNPYAPELRERGALGAVIRRLALVTDRDSLAIHQAVTDSRRRTFLPVRLKRNLSPREVAWIEEGSLDLPGARIRVEPVRRYPHGRLAAHLLGYVGEIAAAEFQRLRGLGYHADDVVGQTGVEKQYDILLHGRNGRLPIEVDAYGRARTFSGGRELEHPVNGGDLVLTLDLTLQRTLEEAMNRGEERSRLKGAAVAMDVWTGEILAMVSRPTFDPNVFAAGLDSVSWRGFIEDPAKPLINRVIQAAYPPGSVFKLLTATAALDSGLVGTQTHLRPCLGQYAFGSRVFGCWRDGGHGSLDLIEAITQSCDVYFYQLGAMLGVEGIARYGRRFAMDGTTGIDLPGERGGLIPDSGYLTERYGRRGWSRGVALNLAIGQGELLFTPIELAVFVAAVANGGERVVPHVVRARRDPEGHRIRLPIPARAPIAGDLRPALERVRGAMRRVVEDERGTGRQAAVKGLSVAGKTGTAQNPHGGDHALFVSYAPVEQPHLVLVVILEGRGHGSAEAAPVAGAFWRAYRDWRESDAEEGVIG